jgi:endogenous inhibitor of DNA gyrase (YacG/DUF329 family)
MKMLRTCAGCGREFTPERPSRLFCSKRCATAYGPWSWPVNQGVEKQWGEAR